VSCDDRICDAVPGKQKPFRTALYLSGSASGSKMKNYGEVPEPQYCSGSGNEIKYNEHEISKNISWIRIMRQIRSQQRYFSHTCIYSKFGQFCPF
jgi:hypothetical protein